MITTPQERRYQILLERLSTLENAETLIINLERTIAGWDGKAPELKTETYNILTEPGWNCLVEMLDLSGWWISYHKIKQVKPSTVCELVLKPKPSL